VRLSAAGRDSAPTCPNETRSSRTCRGS